MTDITLLPLDLASAESLVADADAFARAHRATLPASWPQVAEIAAHTARFLASTGAPAPWISYLALEGAERRIVGTCAFKGGPDAEGAVEIAYFTFPGGEGRGVATSMARELTRIAWAAEPPPGIVRAHTLPERNASGRVLERNGYRRVGEVIDPEDGLVWRWEHEGRASSATSVW